jgi:hypothetical protein
MTCLIGKKSQLGLHRSIFLLHCRSMLLDMRDHLAKAIFLAHSLGP